MTEYGFVAEPHKGGLFLTSPATRDEEGNVQCHDLSGFLGSWPMRDGGVFFPSTSGDSLCPDAMRNANTFAQEKNYNNPLQVRIRKLGDIR